MRFEPLSPRCGSEVHDVDLRQLDDDDIAVLDRAWAERGLLVFRGQQLDPDDHLAFARRFAEVDVNKFFTPVAGHPEIAEVRKEPGQLTNIGGGWHTDHSYDAAPARGSILVARELPPTGGDTEFLHTGEVLGSFDDAELAELRTVRARHSNHHVFGAQTGYAVETDIEMHNPELTGEAVHPVIVRHPETGEESLYVNVAFTVGIEGEDDETGKATVDRLIQAIADHSTTVRLRWEPGTVAMWDNRNTWHKAHNDYHGHRRVMHRVTVAGSELGA